MLHCKDSLKLAAQIIGVELGAPRPHVQYGYYRLMVHYHPDRNPNDARAERLAALINEAKDFLLGRETTPTLLRDRELVAELMGQPVSDQGVLSYEDWLKERFFNMEQCSIWPA
jgi:hypothetical protein